MNFEELGKKVKKLGQDTMTEVQKLNEIRQLNSRINDQKKQMTSVYTKMGQKLYEMYKDGTMEGFEAEFRELEERNAAIGIFQDQIRDIKGVRVCPNCNVEVSVNERFCSSCGHKLPEILKIEKQEDGTDVIEGTESEVIDAEMAAENCGEMTEEVKEATETVEEAVQEEAAEASEENAVDENGPEAAGMPEESGQAEEAENTEKPEQAEEAESAEESEQAEEAESAEKPEQAEEAESAEKPEQAEEAENAEESEQSEEAEAAEKAE